jgi:acetylornithine deacetylase
MIVPTAREIASRLIGFNTTVDQPGDAPIAEAECQGYVGGLLEAAGFEVDTWEPAVEDMRSHPMYRPPQNWRNRPITVGRLRGRGGGRSLILNGHIDTVPGGDVSEWTSDPWHAEIRDGRLYGRGACDMKGGLACALHAALAHAASGRPLAGDLIVEAVTDEEINGLGTVACLMRGYRADAAIVPEPTMLDMWRAFRGILVGHLQVNGRAGHVEVAQPHWTRGGGVNAITKALPLLEALRNLSDDWRTRPDKQHPVCSPGEIQPTIIRGGDFPSTIPAGCQVALNICYVPGEEDAEGMGANVKREIEEYVRRAALTDPWLAENPPRISWDVELPPAEIPETVDLVRELQQTAAQQGATSRARGLDTWDDTASLILAGIPAVSFGPGSDDQAHGVDEYVDLDQLDWCGRILAAFVERWCGVAEQ